MQQPTWRKSTYSGGDNTNCVEVAQLSNGAAVRDSKDPAGPKLTFPAAAWAAFTAGIHAGDFK